LRRGGTLITLPQLPEANQMLGEVAEELGVRGVSAVEYMPPLGASPGAAYAIEAFGETVVVDSPLRGAHQQRNLALAIAAAVELKSTYGQPVTAASIAAGIRQTRWPGRMERIAGDGVEWLLDVAHNPAGAWALRSGLTELLEQKRPRRLVFSCLRDKPAAEMAQILFPLFDEVILAPIHSARATALAELEAAAVATGSATTVAASVDEALKLAAQRSQGGVVVVSGSVYLVGEARTLLLKQGVQP